MSSTNEAGTGHSHVFLGENHARNERRVWLVIALTAATMVIEIVAGTIYGSMALVADGFHMSTHAAAMLIAAGAYYFARRHAHDRRFTFGTGKVGDLAGFASAIVLALVALFIGYESFARFLEPVPISFAQAIAVASLGLLVNLASAWLLREDHAHHHHGHGHHHHDHGNHQAHEHREHDHPHDHGDHGHAHRAGHDHNLRAAYLHVLADALTSVLAIVALLFGSLYGWIWLDPMMGIVGAVIIARWSWGLVRTTGAVLLDYVPHEESLPHRIREVLEAEGDQVADLHVWQVGPGHRAAIVSIVTDEPKHVAHYRAKLEHIRELSHLTVEVEEWRAA